MLPFYAISGRLLLQHGVSLLCVILVMILMMTMASSALAAHHCRTDSVHFQSLSFQGRFRFFISGIQNLQLVLLAEEILMYMYVRRDIKTL